MDTPLGRGGSAVVYLARRADDGSPVALKVLDRDHPSAEDRSRLEREFQLARALTHPHIITMYERGPHWLAMQYVDGGDATALATPAERLAALAQIADALDYAHRMGTVHCDVKPANILVHRASPAKGAVLIDFGVAHSLAKDISILLARDTMHRLSLDPARRITSQQPGAATVHASLPYAAPEVLLGRMPSGAADEYSLACTALELIVGAPPFAADTPAALIDAHLEAPPPRLSRSTSWLPRKFDSIIGKALAKDPEARYPSCTEFVETITRALR